MARVRGAIAKEEEKMEDGVNTEAKRGGERGEDRERCVREKGVGVGANLREFAFKS